MKRIASIGLILLMSLQCFYKLGVITYFQLNRDYIAEVLCVNREKPMTMCYGQCFLHTKLDLADDDSSDNGTLPTGKQRVELPNFLISEHNYFVQGIKQLVQINSRYLLIISCAHHSAPFHPPALLL